MTRTLLFGALCAALFAVAPAALAQRAADFPSKTVRIVVPFPAGGTTDTTARVVANALAGLWKQTVLIENRPGGNQVIGADAVAKSAPDGYNLLIASHGLMFEHLLNKEIPIQPLRDFTPIANVVGSGLFFIVPPVLPVSSFAEFVAYAKANPGKVNQAQIVAGIVELKDFWQRLGVEVVDVNYKGGQQALAAIITNEVQLYAHSPGDVVQQLKAGKIKVIAYSDRVRHPALPDVPALPEASGLSHSYRFWFGMWGPANMPPDLVGRINASLNEALKVPEVRDRLAGLGVQIYGGTPEEMRTEVSNVVKRIEDLLARGYKLR
jgi:tripartite-type tricarboxylate transporter receptor subunit TctC